MMSRQSLRALTLRANSSDRFVSDELTRIHISDLRTHASLNAGRAYGCSVLLKTTRQLPSILAALDLDGIARRIVLCPADQWQHVPSIIQRAAIDIVVTDGPDDFPMVIRPEYGLGSPVSSARDIDTEWILLTSGTTGEPKLVIHTLASLTGPLDDGIGATGAIWSTFYDGRRYGGLQMLLRALLGGGSMVLSGDGETPTDFLIRLGRAGVTHLSGTPSHWRRALMSPAIAAITPTYVRLSGEITNQAILDHLRRTFPQAILVQAFASTEAGVAFDVRDGKAGFPASVFTNACREAKLQIVEGTLHIRSLRTARGYIGAPLAGSGGFVDTGDFVEERGDRYYFCGRKEGVINIGGQKVHPEEIEAVIAQHPDIQMARVWARKNPVTGAVVAADVVLADSTVTLGDIRADIIEHCRQHLAAWKVPVTLGEVCSIDLSPAGKIERG